MFDLLHFSGEGGEKEGWHDGGRGIVSIQYYVFLREGRRYEMCGSRKYPYPHHGGIGNSEGEGGSKTQEIPGGRGVV